MADRGKEKAQRATENVLPSVIPPPPEQLLRVRNLRVVGHRVVALQWGEEGASLATSGGAQRTSGAERITSMTPHQPKKKKERLEKLDSDHQSQAETRKIPV